MKAKDVFFHWEQVRRELFQAIDMLDDEMLSFVPRQGLRSLGDTLRHIANAEKGWFGYVVEGKVEEWPPAYRAEDYPSVESIKKLLTDVHNRTEDFLEPLSLDDLEEEIEAPWGHRFALKWIIWHIIDHEIHHRGEVFLMLGLMGMEAPDI